MLTIILLPIIGAFIGWITNYVAVKMLFHPKQPWNLVLFKVQGVFPKRQAAFAERLSAIVSEELFSMQEVSDHLSQKATSPSNLELISKRIEGLLLDKVPKAIPMAAMFIKAEHIQSILELVKPDLNSMISDLVHKISLELESELDVKKIIHDKVAAFSSDKLEEIIFTIMRQELTFIEIVGGVLGFFIGCAQVGLTYLS